SMLPMDLRDAFRGFARHPAFAAAAILSLAVGVGANTAIFSVASALLLRPLPYPDPSRLVILWNRSPGLGVSEDSFSTAEDLDMNGRPFQIVGVLPESFSLPHEVLPTLGNATDAEMIIPLPLGPAAAQARNREDFNIVGRLKPGRTPADLQTELDGLTARLRR